MNRTPRAAAMATVALAAVLSRGAGAQTAPAEMNHAPAIGAAQAYTPPRSETDQLPNGLKIVVIPDHRFPLISVRMAIRAGNTRLAPAQAGLASAEASLLTSGAPGLTALGIAQELDAMGGSIQAAASDDYLTISADALSTEARPLLRLLAAVVLRPTFPASQVALHQANMLQELIANRASSGYLANVLFDRLLYGPEHPYAQIAPTRASIAAISRAALVAFHRRWFLPNNGAEIVVAGDIDGARAHNLVQQFFGDWKFGNPRPAQAPAVAPPARRTIALINRPGSPQSTILMGNLGLTRTAPDYFPMLVANEVLGGSFNSRLMADVREKEGYAYGIGSANVPHLDAGAWVIETQVRTGVTAKALQSVFDEMNRIRTGPITPTELTQAKNYLTGNFVLGLQTQDEVADQFLTTGIYHLPSDRLATWIPKVEQVTGAEAHAAAVGHIHPDHAVVVVVGEAPRIEATLAPLAPGGRLTLYNDRNEVVGRYPPGTATGRQRGGAAEAAGAGTPLKDR